MTSIATIYDQIQSLMQDRFVFYSVIAILILIMLVCIIQILMRRRKNTFTNIPDADGDVAKYHIPPEQSYSQTTFGGTGSTKTVSSRNSTGQSGDEIDLTTLPTTDRRSRIFGSMTEPLAALLPTTKEQETSTKKELVQAGYFSPFAWMNLSAIRYLGIMVPLIVCGILLLFVPPQYEFYVIVAAIVLPIMGWGLPRILVRSRGKERIAKIEHGMPDMIDMLNMCVSQGLSLVPSLRRVSTELTGVHPELSKELNIVARQAEISTVEQAFMNFNKRVDSTEVHSFTSLLLQTEHMGTSVSDALTTYSDNMRENLKQRADEKANTSSFKLLFPTVLCFMPAVFLFLLGPAIVELSDFFYGPGRQALENNTRTAISVLNTESGANNP